MKKTEAELKVRRAEERGHNDDPVATGRGFGTHPHRDMENIQSVKGPGF